MRKKKFFGLHSALVKRRLKRFFGVPSFSKTQKKPLHAMIAVVLLIVIFVNIFKPDAQIVQGATYTFVQAGWAGGASSTAVAVHPTNQTQWTYFNTSTNISFASTTALALTTSSYSFTDDGTLTTTGDDTGGGFGNGSVSSVLVSGSGSAGQIQLATTSQETLDIWDSSPRGIPATVSTGGDIEYAANGIYVLRGNTTNDVYKYSTSTNAWTQLTDLPATVGNTDISDMESDGTYLYVRDGGGSKTIYRHLLSNTTDQWDSFSITGLPNWIYGNILVDANYIYMQDTSAKTMKRHTTSNTSSAWESFTALSSSPAMSNPRIAMNSTDIFVLPVSTATSVFKHALSDTSSAWIAYPAFTSGITFAALEVSETSIFVSTGRADTFLRDIADTTSAWTTSSFGSTVSWPTMAKDDTYVYLNHGNTVLDVYRRGLSDTTSAWTSLPDVPSRSYKQYGGTIEYGENNIYVIEGSTKQGIWKRTTANTTDPWTGTNTSTFTAVPGTVNTGGGISADGSYVYVVRADTSANVYRHQLASTTVPWDSFSTTGLGNVNFGDNAINSTDIFILFSNSVFKHALSDTTSAWTSFASFGSSIANGNSIAVNDADVYAFLGSTTTLRRHTLSTTTGDWDTFAAIPTSTLTTGTDLLLTDTDVYILQGGGAGVYKHTLSDTSSAWDSFTPLPGTIATVGFIRTDGTYLYVARGGSSNVYRHALSDTSSAWTSLSTSGLVSITTGGGMEINGTDIYLRNGSQFSKHTLANTTDAWTALQPPHASSGAGGGLVMGTNDQEIYTVLGGDTINFSKYIISQVTYAASGNFTSASIDVGAQAFTTIAWTSTEPTGVGANAIQIQIATSSDNSNWSSYVGSDGTSGTYFDTSGQSISNIGGARYLKYKAYLATADTALTPTLSNVTISYVAYVATGTVSSSIYDSNDATNVFSDLSWSETLTSGTDVKFQARTASTSALISEATFVGPDGTASSYFTDPTGDGESPTSTMQDGVNDRFIQYQAFLTSNGVNTPTLASTTVTYVVNATPEIQNVTATANADGTVTITYEARDPDTNTGSRSPGYVSTTFQYCPISNPSDCSSYPITGFPTGTGVADAVTTSNWTSYTATWTPRTDLGSGIWDASAGIKVIVNDNEAANNTASATSTPFILDTGSPSGSVVVDASTTPAFLTISASDTSTIQMKVSTSSSMTGASWQDYATTSTISLVTDPDTVYVQFKDAYGNTSTIVSATTPETPTGLMVQDISNVKDGATDYRLFLAWKVVATPFASYKVYRSEDQLTWSLIKTETTRTTNFHTDSTTTVDITYYYRVITADSSGNTSYYSSSLSGAANGVQDGQEGGGATAVAAQPTISNTSTSSLTPSSITITWDTDVLSDSRIGYSTTPGNFTDNTVTVSSMKNNAASIGQHAVALVGLAPNTTFYYQVKSVNVDNVSSTAPTSGDGYSFTTLDGTTISGVANTEVSNSRAVVTWSSADNASSYVVYSTSSNFAASVTTGTADSVTSHSITVTGLIAATNYYYYVYSVTAGGVTTTDRNIINGETEYYRFTTTNDSSAPSITSISATALTSSANISWNTSEAADSQVVYGTTTAYGTTTTLDNTMTVQHLVALSDLSGGTLYHYKVISADSNGNSTQSTDRTFTTLSTSDTTAPLISNVATSSVSLTSATITWSTDELTNYLVDYGTSGSYGSVAGDASDYSTSTHSVTLSSLSGTTQYYFRVRSQDATGNTATSSQYTFTTTPDTTDPTISNVQTSVVNNTSANITWTTNEAANSEVWYGTDVSSLTSSETTSTLETTHSVTLNGLSKLTGYYYYVKSADSAANTTTENNSSAYYTFTTLRDPVTIIGGGGSGALIDKTSPNLIKILVTVITADSATVTWESDEEGLSMLQYGLTDKYGSMIGSGLDKKTKHSLDLKNLKSGSIYHFKALTYDASGNIGESADQKFTTLNADGTTAEPTTSTQESAVEEEESTELADAVKSASAKALQKILEALAKNPYLTKVPEETFIKALSEMTDKVVEAPEIVGIRPTVEVKGTTAIIRWTTDKKSTSAVSYAKDSQYKSSEYTHMAVNPDEFSNRHNVELTNLIPATVYHYQVMSRGVIGPEAKSADFTFVTQSELPVITDIRIQTVKESAVNIVWKTNIPTTANIEYTNGRTGQTLTQGDTAMLMNHNFTLKNLEGATDYTLVLKAKDEFGNEVASTPIKFSTSKDIVAPVISKLSSDSTLYPGKDSRVQTIISWETDEPATSQIFYQEGVAKEGKILELPIDSSLVTRHIVVLTKFKPGSVYKFWVESKDISENKSKSEVFSVLTPIEKETIIDIIIKNFESVFGWTKRIGI